MAGNNRLSIDEKKWSEEQVKLLPEVTYSSVRNSNIMEEYKTRFGKEISIITLYQRFKKIANPTYKSSPQTKNPELLFEKSDYLVYLKDVGVQGFDTEAEVKSFLEKSKILGNVRLFKVLPIQLEYKVSIG